MEVGNGKASESEPGDSEGLVLIVCDTLGIRVRGLAYLQRRLYKVRCYSICDDLMPSLGLGFISQQQASNRPSVGLLDSPSPRDANSQPGPSLALEIKQRPRYPCIEQEGSGDLQNFGNLLGTRRRALVLIHINLSGRGAEAERKQGRRQKSILRAHGT